MKMNVPDIFIIDFAPVMKQLGLPCSLVHLFDSAIATVTNAATNREDKKDVELLDNYLYQIQGLRVLRDYFNSAYSNPINEIQERFKPEDNSHIRQMVYAFADIEDIENAKSDITTLLLAYLESDSCDVSNRKDRTSIAYSLQNVLYMLQGAKSYKEEGKEEKFEKF